MNNLIIALFKLLVDRNVLNVQASIVLEPLFNGPVLAVLNLSVRLLLSWHVFYCDLDCMLELMLTYS
jgi:hypothetical protein